MNFQKLFEDYKIDYSLKTNRGWVNTKCIYCGGSSYKLGFNPTEDYCTCFACGLHNLKETLSKLLAIPKKNINDVIEQYKTRTIILNKLNDKKTTAVKNLVLPTDTFTPIERKYLKSRNFNPSYLHKKYNVVGGGIVGDWKYRIIIPVIINGKIVSWTGRSILEKSKLDELKIPRYKNLEIKKSVINPKECLFNLDNSKNKTVVLTEGPFDVMRLGDDFICSFGTSLTQSQIKEIRLRYDKVFIMFDNEIEAQQKARNYGQMLSSVGVDVEIVDAYSDFNKNDGGELNDEEVKLIRKELCLSY